MLRHAREYAAGRVWLHTGQMFHVTITAVFATSQTGLQSPEHAAFLK